MPALVRHALLVFSPRGPMAARRMTAYGGVLAAAALTTLVAAAVAAAVAVFMGQALPLAVQHDLSIAPGTDMSVTALVNDAGQASSGGATLRSQIAAAMPGVPFTFESASWSDPLGLVPGSLPASPTNAGAGSTALLQAASMSGLAGHATLLAGRWPAAPAAGVSRAGGGAAAIPAALPASAAKLLHVSVGDVLRLRDRVDNALVSFDVTGVFAARAASGPDDSYWALSYIPPGGVSASYTSSTYGPLVVSPAAFGTGLTQQSGSWLAQPVMKDFQNGSLSSDSGNVAALVASLPNATFLNGAQLTTSLPTALDAAGSNLTVAVSLLVISALQVLVLAVVALAAVGRLLAAQREGETALLIARGATRWQLTKLTATEVVPLSALVSALGALAGVWLAEALVGAGALGPAGLRLAGRPGVWPDALAAAIVVALIAVAALLAPGLTAVARAHSGRQGLVAGVTRAGLDIALIVLAVLACWQLRQFSAVGARGTGGIDPVLALAPALALAAGSVVVLRLLPLAAVVADWLAARGRGLLAALASWQFSRMPVRQASSALLLVMAVAAGTLALAQHQSWARSAADQANFAAGADVQVDLPTALSPGEAGAVADARGVTRALAVAVDNTGTPGELVALDSAQAAGVVRLRSDETPLPPARLFAAITPSAAQHGAALPAPRPGAGSGTIPVTVTLGPAAPTTASPDASGVAAALGPVVMTLTVLDRTGAAFQVEDGDLVADGRPHLIAVPLGGDQGALPAAGGRDHGHVRDAAARRADPRANAARRAAGRLDAAGEHARPDRLPAQGSRRALRRSDAHHRRGGHVHLRRGPRARHRGGRRRDRPDPAGRRAAAAASARGPGAGHPRHRDESLHEREQPADRLGGAGVGGRGDGAAANRGRGGLVPDRHRPRRRADHRSRPPAGVPGPSVASPAARSPSGGWPRRTEGSRRR